MSNQVVPLPQRAAPSIPSVTFGEMERLAESIAKSGMFGMKTKEQALALMAISQAEGRHPALAARDYDIIQGRPAKKAEAMLRDFMECGGRVEWHDLSDTVADATFSHPSGGTARIKWDMERAKVAGLLGKENYKKYPRQMLRSRCASEGVRTVCPAATSGMYGPEEVADFDARPAPPSPPPPRQQVIAPPSPPPAPKPTGNGNGLSEADERELDRASMREMRRETPEHDPDTGEVGPREVVALKDRAGNTAWVAWGREMMEHFRAAGTTDELSEWLAANEAQFASCEKDAPKAYASVVKAYQARVQEFKTVDATGLV